MSVTKKKKFLSKIKAGLSQQQGGKDQGKALNIES
jgi:hypothetical protein